MNTISENVTVNQSVGLNRYVKDSKQAKITGMLCVGCSIVAGLFSVAEVFPSFIASLMLMLYFLFLLMSATLGLFGFQEVFCSRNGKLSSSISMISVVLLLVLVIIVFGVVFSSNSEMMSILIQFWVFFGLLSTVIPIFLTISALISNNPEKWKSLMPLVIPVLFILSWMMANSKNSIMALLLLPISWGLLGIVAYLGNVSLNSNADLEK